jgi:hypothetical protein
VNARERVEAITTKQDMEIITAAILLVGRTGAQNFQIRFSDDAQPVVWMAAAQWGERWEAAGATTPRGAVVRFLEAIVDGGTCGSCGKPTGITEDFAQTMPGPKLICWWQYDPEVKEFRRGCEGEVPRFAAAKK